MHKNGEEKISSIWCDAAKLESILTWHSFCTFVWNFSFQQEMPKTRSFISIEHGIRLCNIHDFHIPWKLPNKLYRSQYILVVTLTQAEYTQNSLGKYSTEKYEGWIKLDIQYLCSETYWMGESKFKSNNMDYRYSQHYLWSKVAQKVLYFSNINMVME